MSMLRTRWAAVGAAIAVTLGAGGISLSEAAIGSGDKPVFVAITPCRLIDTRGDVGPRSTPLSAGETITLQITGSTGECSGIPAGAVAAAMNVTAIRPTEQSYLTVYPADAGLPKASNLNWAAGDPPTPNKVDVKLSATGAVKMTNAFGTVHIAADLVGYFIDHTHADLYYTKSEVDDLLTAVVAAASSTQVAVSQVGTATVSDTPQVVVSASITPPAGGDVVALGLVVGDPAAGVTEFGCSLSTTTSPNPGALQRHGGGLAQIVTATGFTGESATELTISMVCERIAGTGSIDFENGSLRLFYFPG